MAELAGNKARIRISATKMTSASDGYEVKGAESTGLNKLKELLEVTALGDDYKRRIVGLKDTEIPLKGSIITDDDGQDLFDNDYVYIAIYPEGFSEAGTQVYMVIESVNYTYEVSGKQDFDVSLKGNGAPEIIGA